MTTHIEPLIIREAQPTDVAALERLAALDSGRVPSGRLLVAEADGKIQAAVPLAGGPAIADPFRSTTASVSLLGLRAAQLRGLRPPPEVRWSASPPAGRPCRRWVRECRGDAFDLLRR